MLPPFPPLQEISKPLILYIIHFLKGETSCVNVLDASDIGNEITSEASHRSSWYDHMLNLGRLKRENGHRRMGEEATSPVFLFSSSGVHNHMHSAFLDCAPAKWLLLGSLKNKELLFEVSDKHTSPTLEPERQAAVCLEMQLASDQLLCP